MPRVIQKVVNLFPEGSGGRKIKVLIKRTPSPEELCSITSEPIGSADVEVPYAPSDKHCIFSHLHHLTCAEMPCGHRFHATALLVHLMRNGLRCPLCRSGSDKLPRYLQLTSPQLLYYHSLAY